MKVQDYFESEANWLQRKFMLIDENGEYGACCLLGAIRLCYSANEQDRVVRQAKEYIKTRYDQEILIVWNDLSTTTFKDVKELVETLDI